MFWHYEMAFPFHPCKEILHISLTKRKVNLISMSLKLHSTLEHFPEV